MRPSRHRRVPKKSVVDAHVRSYAGDDSISLGICVLTSRLRILEARDLQSCSEDPFDIPLRWRAGAQRITWTKWQASLLKERLETSGTRKENPRIQPTRVSESVKRPTRHVYGIPCRDCEPFRTILSNAAKFGYSIHNPKRFLFCMMVQWNAASGRDRHLK